MNKLAVLVLAILAVVFVSGGCTRAQLRNFGQALEKAEERRYKEAEYNYHTRPYKFDGVIYAPSR